MADVFCDHESISLDAKQDTFGAPLWSCDVCGARATETAFRLDRGETYADIYGEDY